jgi:hypothetical protein
LEPLNTFRVAVARYTLLLAFICAVAAWPFDPNASKGVLLGGFAGTIGFWITARNMSVLTRRGGPRSVCLQVGARSAGLLWHGDIAGLDL